ncbi:MAG TPA: LysR substrate-binding domain-containing protein [Gaiellaceae bacterium]|nr:LysR substrate-binding domain-containing protein [Gaiellaceae bacterium]
METKNGSDQWLGLEFRHIVALETVARTGSFGRAAAVLGYTQSGVSQQIGGLERIVGEKLIERPGRSRKASLTEPGEVLLRHAEAITARLDAARADIAALRAGQAGRLRIGTYQSIGARLLPAAMRRFSDEWPAVEIRLSEPHTDGELYDGLERGELDLAFCSLPLDEGPFDALELMSDPYILLVPRDSELAERELATLDDVGDRPIIGCAATGERLHDALRASGYALEFAFRSDNNGTLQGLVSSGFGVALVPLLAVTPEDPRVAVVRFAPPVPPRRIAVAWHRDRHRSPGARAFIDAARAASAQLEQVVAGTSPIAAVDKNDVGASRPQTH